jgi:hypothetical protein
VRQTQTRGLPRLPGCVERPRDVFNPNVSSVRCVPGRRVLLNATPANGLFAPTSDRSEDVECNAPPSWALVARHLLLLVVMQPLEILDLRFALQLEYDLE